MFFKYQAKDVQGRTVSGNLEAIDLRNAADKVRDLGYFPMSIVPDPLGGSVSPNPDGSAVAVNRTGSITAQAGGFKMENVSLGRGAPVWELSMMYRQLASMTNAGVGMDRALWSVAEQTGNRRIHKALSELSLLTNSGTPLSDGMRRFPHLFPLFHRSLVLAGEATGDMPVIFDRIAQSLEQEQELRSLISRELLMPQITLVSSFLLPPLFYFFIGKPMMYVREAIFPLLEMFGIIGALWFLTRIAAGFRLFYDRVLASVPPIGGAVRMIAIARFARTVSAMYAAGIPLPTTIRLSAAASGNMFMAQRLSGAALSLEAGHSIFDALKSTGVLPSMVLGMISTSQETGSLDAMMTKVAEFYESESAHKLRRLAMAANALATIVVGYKVLTILIQFYSGYYKNLLDTN